MSNFELVQKQTLEGGYDLARKQTLEGDIAVSQTVVLKEEQEKSIDIIENGEYSVKPDLGKTMSEVNVNVNIPERVPKLQDTTISENGTYNADSGYDGFGNVIVAVPSNGLDTSDATVTASDMAEGVTAYGKDGKVVGTLSVKKNLSTSTPSINYHSDTKQLSTANTITQDAIVKKGVSFHWVDGAKLGNATASDVAKGKTFTSENGLKIEGTRESESGLDTSDATVTADDLAENVVAYGKNGERVVGDVFVHEKYSGMNHTSVLKYNTSKKLGVIHKTSFPRLFRKDSEVEVYIPYANFGTASASDVAKGKTFSSAEGYLVEGTREGEGGSTEFTITDDGNGNVMISGLSVANDGNGNVTIS